MKKIWYWDRYSGSWKLLEHIHKGLGFISADELALIWQQSMEYYCGAPAVVSTDTPS